MLSREGPKIKSGHLEHFIGKGLSITTTRGHTEVWESFIPTPQATQCDSITPTQGATPKCGRQ